MTEGEWQSWDHLLSALDCAPLWGPRTCTRGKVEGGCPARRPHCMSSKHLPLTGGGSVGTLQRATSHFPPDRPLHGEGSSTLQLGTRQTGPELMAWEGAQSHWACSGRNKAISTVARIRHGSISVHCALGPEGEAAVRPHRTWQAGCRGGHGERGRLLRPAQGAPIIVSITEIMHPC